MIGRVVAFLLASLPNLVPVGLDEPSGLAWHHVRGTLFVVGDEGHVAEVGPDGVLLGEVAAFEGPHCRRDLEAVAVDPRTGNLLIAVEPSWELVVWDPEEREEVERHMLAGSPGECADPYWGLEGLTVLGPDEEREGNLLILAAKQGKPAEFLTYSLPLPGHGKAVLLSREEAPFSSVSDVLADGEVLWVLEGYRGRLHRFEEGLAAGVWHLPFPLAEGLSFSPDGALWIADDTGGLYRLEPGALGLDP